MRLRGKHGSFYRTTHYCRPGAVTNVALTTVVAEKPFIIVDTANPTKFSLAIPNPRFNSTGSDWDVGRTVPFEQVYVASNATDTSVSNLNLCIISAPERIMCSITLDGTEHSHP